MRRAALSAVALWLLAGLAAITVRAQPVDAPPLAMPAAGARLVQIRQLDAKGALIGTPSEFACPDSGCQTPLTLAIGDHHDSFLFSVQFVASGAYVTLAPRSISIAQVIRWGEGHKGPIFVPLDDTRPREVSLSFIVVRSATLQALEPGHGADVLASGPVFNSKRHPDLTLAVRFSPPGPPGAGK